MTGHGIELELAARCSLMRQNIVSEYLAAISAVRLRAFNGMKLGK